MVIPESFVRSCLDEGMSEAEIEAEWMHVQQDLADIESVWCSNHGKLRSECRTAGCDCDCNVTVDPCADGSTFNSKKIVRFFSGVNA